LAAVWIGTGAAILAAVWIGTCSILITSGSISIY
jgi:hypothetical protein